MYLGEPCEWQELVTSAIPTVSQGLQLVDSWDLEPELGMKQKPCCMGHRALNPSQIPALWNSVLSLLLRDLGEKVFLGTCFKFLSVRSLLKAFSLLHTDI